MSLQTEVWATDIANELFKGRDWLKIGRNDDGRITNKTVHVPQSNSSADVKMDRQVLPAPITQRVDTTEKYDMHEFTSNPTLITDVDETEVSYNKRIDVIRDHIEGVPDRITDYAASVYADGVQMLDTTGEARDDEGGILTGQRKRVTAKDLSRAMAYMTLRKIPVAGRHIIIDPMAWVDILDNDKLASRNYTDNVNLETGQLGTLYGFKVWGTAEVAYVKAGTSQVIAPGAVVPGTAERVCLILQERFIRRAIGQVKVYSDLDKPEYFGSIFSSRMRFGCSHQYTDKRGVLALRQVTA